MSSSSDNGVSAVITVHNEEEFIEETLQSVVNQTTPCREIIVVDDGSTDHTEELVKGFNNDRIRYIYQENQGVSAARNRGIQEANHEFIALLDGDDTWLPHKIETQLQYAGELPDYGMYYSDFRRIDRDGNRLPYRRTTRHTPSGWIFRDLFRRNVIQPSTTLIRSECFENVGTFNEEIPRKEDYELWLRIALKYQIDGRSEPLSNYRIREDSRSSARKTSRIAMKTLLKSLYQKAKGTDQEVSRDLLNQRLTKHNYKIARKQHKRGNPVEAAKFYRKALDINRLQPKTWIYYLLSKLGL